MNNELLKDSVLNFDVNFEKLIPEMFEEALAETLALAKKELDTKRELRNPTFKELWYDKAVQKFGAVFNVLQNLTGLKEDQALRDIEEKYEEKWNEFSLSWLFDKKLFKQTEAFLLTEEYKQLSDTRKRMVNKSLSDWRKSGIGLSVSQQKKFAKLKDKASKLSFKFGNNITDSQKFLSLVVSRNSLRGLSERSWRNAEKLSKEHGLPEDKIYIDEISGLFSDVMTDVRNESVRKRIYNMRKKSCVSGKHSNVKIINELYKTRQEKTQMLGYKDVAEMVLEENMAANAERVADFIKNLGNTAIPHARNDIKTLYEFGEKLLKRPVQPWDISYVWNKMEKKLAKLDNEELRKFFPVTHVIDGLFKFCAEKFDVHFKAVPEKSVWHKDVTYYDVYEGNTYLGGIYFDLFKREGKRSGAWLAPLKSSCNNEDESSFAYAMLVCNSNKDEGTPTFSHDEVVTLFHEMGHGLHHILSKAKEEFYSGFNHVQFDAIEFPSQFLELFAYNEEVLKMISCHIETQEKLNGRWIKKIQDSKKFLGSLRIMNTLIYSDIDQKIYTQHTAHPLDIENEVREKWMYNENADKLNYKTPSFHHIFGGGYAANYYSYQWAEVMSADAYEYLTEKVSKNELNKRFNQYKTHVLYTGGEQSMANNYHDFVGREPKFEALVAQYI